MKYSSTMKKIVAVILWCGVSVSCVAEEALNPDTVSAPKEANTQSIPQYKIVPDPQKQRYIRDGVCEEFLKILNTTPYETIFQDPFLNILKGRGDFDTMDWQLLEDGEAKYGEMVFKRFEIEEKPERVAKRIEGYRKFKEKVGGFDYYLVHADIFNNGTVVPVLVYVNKNLQELDKRRGWDYVVMEADMSGPNQAYKIMGLMHTSHDGLLFRYKDKTYRLDLFVQAHPYISEIRNSFASCDFSLMK